MPRISYTTSTATIRWRRFSRRYGYYSIPTVSPLSCINALKKERGRKRPQGKVASFGSNRLDVRLLNKRKKQPPLAPESRGLRTRTERQAFPGPAAQPQF